nr:MAG TPA: hypothetical protein [Caudoviricetes sp.]
MIGSYIYFSLKGAMPFMATKGSIISLILKLQAIQTFCISVRFRASP